MAIAKRKKRFFDVEMPLIEKTTQLLGYEIEDINGSFIKYDLTRMLRGKSSLMRFKVKVTDGKATATADELTILPYFIKRMVRKGTNYIEDSFEAECSDAIVRIKPFLISRRKISREVRKALRNKAKEELINYLKTRDSQTIFRDLLRNQIQKELGIKLKKVYPLSLCEIRIFKVEKMKATEKKKE